MDCRGMKYEGGIPFQRGEKRIDDTASVRRKYADAGYKGGSLSIMEMRGRGRQRRKRELDLQLGRWE